MVKIGHQGIGHQVGSKAVSYTWNGFGRRSSSAKAVQLEWQKQSISVRHSKALVLLQRDFLLPRSSILAFLGSHGQSVECFTCTGHPKYQRRSHSLCPLSSLEFVWRHTQGMRSVIRGHDHLGCQNWFQKLFEGSVEPLR